LFDGAHTYLTCLTELDQLMVRPVPAPRSEDWVLAGPPPEMQGRGGVDSGHGGGRRRPEGFDER